MDPMIGEPNTLAALWGVRRSAATSSHPTVLSGRPQSTYAVFATRRTVCLLCLDTQLTTPRAKHAKRLRPPPQSVSLILQCIALRRRWFVRA
jgi:hypothetical protein